MHNDPKIGTSIAVAEAARNIVCAGGKPSAITNCLNFGNPYNPEAYWQFVMAIKGMSEACIRFKTPVTGGNVSFYNQTVREGAEAVPVLPTPTIGMIGMVDDLKRVMTLDFKAKGDLIFLIGESQNDLAGSEYLYTLKGVKRSPAPYFDMDRELDVQAATLGLIQNGLINAALDISDGGLFTTLVEMGIHRGFGFDVTADADVRLDAFLFGEAQGRIIVTLDPEFEGEFIEAMRKTVVPFTLMGHVTRGKMVIDDSHFGFIDDASDVYLNSLERKLDSSVTS